VNPNDRGVRRSLPGASVEEAYAEGDAVLKRLQRKGGELTFRGERALRACALVQAGKLEVVEVTVRKRAP
jgi:hypothetical protein